MAPSFVLTTPERAIVIATPEDMCSKLRTLTGEEGERILMHNFDRLIAWLMKTTGADFGDITYVPHKTRRVIIKKLST